MSKSVENTVGKGEIASKEQFLLFKRLVLQTCKKQSLFWKGLKCVSCLQSSPPQICPTGRVGDGDTIVQIINSAEKYVHIAVMDYFPTTQFRHPREYVLQYFFACCRYKAIKEKYNDNFSLFHSILFFVKVVTFYSPPDNKVLALSKLKALVDDTLIVDQRLLFVYHLVGNITGKRENKCYQ